MLWRMLERTRRLLAGHCKRFCIRNVLKAWFDLEANDDFIWQVCHMCELEGMNELPRPSLYPRQHRDLLRAIVAARTGISVYKMDVVPYVTEISRSSASVDTHRSKYGKYQVVIGEALKIDGFNLPTTEATTGTINGYFKATT